MKYEVPADSLFANGWTVSASSVADVPERLKAQIREEALLDAFHQLEASLRLLLYATTPDKEPPTAERCHQILNVWRYELEHRIRLTPDTYCGAVQRYEPEMERAYTIDGRCERGDLLRIRVPCWRMHDRIVVRGEAEILKGDQIPTELPPLSLGEEPEPALEGVPTLLGATAAGIVNPVEAQAVIQEVLAPQPLAISTVDEEPVAAMSESEAAASKPLSTDADDFAALRAVAMAEVDREGADSKVTGSA